MPPFLPAALLALLPQAAPAAPVAPPAKPYKLDQRLTEELELVDLAGKSHRLFAEHEQKTILLVFWSYRDPVSRHYAKPLAELQQAHAEQLVVYLVDSNHDELVGAGEPLAKLREVLQKEQVTLPLLLDPKNRLADDFGATANGQAFLLDANRHLRYSGGIDDDPRGEKKAQGVPTRAWLADALASVLAAERPKENWTRPAGRPIKRAPSVGSAPSGGPK